VAKVNRIFDSTKEKEEKFAFGDYSHDSSKKIKEKRAFL